MFIDFEFNFVVDIIHDENHTPFYTIKPNTDKAIEFMSNYFRKKIVRYNKYLVNKTQFNLFRNAIKHRDYVSILS